MSPAFKAAIAADTIMIPAGFLDEYVKISPLFLFGDKRLQHPCRTALAIKGSFKAQVVVKNSTTNALICTASAPFTVP